MSLWARSDRLTISGLAFSSMGFMGRPEGLIGEDADPELTLTLHVAGHCHTSCFDLATGDPFGLEGLDAERTEGELVAALGVTFGATFLGSAEFGFFRL